MNQYFPSSKEEAVDTLLSEMNDAELKSLMNCDENELIMLHHGFGTRIRNEFGLWQGNEKLIEDCCGKKSKDMDPNAASMEIIKAAWKKLTDEGY